MNPGITTGIDDIAIDCQASTSLEMKTACFLAFTLQPMQPTFPVGTVLEHDWGERRPLALSTFVTQFAMESSFQRSDTNSEPFYQCWFGSIQVVMAWDREMQI